MSTQPPPMPPADPYQPPGAAPVSAARISSDVSGPAMGLLVTAIFSGVSQFILIVFQFLGAGFLGSLFTPVNEQRFTDWVQEVLGGVFFSALGLLIAGLIFYASIEMLKLRHWGLAVAASILAMIPCFYPLCCFIGLPIGIWSLVILMRDDVKAAFHGSAV